MELADLAQTSARMYHDVGTRHGWRKGRNSPRGYDSLTIPLDTWDDRPQQRYLALLDHHLSTAADQLDSCAGDARLQHAVSAATLAREVFVASSKATWLLDDTVGWTQRAARAHLELFANVDEHVRSLPKKIESGHPNFQRRRWKEARDRWDTDVIAPLFGKRALTGKREELTLAGEALLTSMQLRERFSTLWNESCEASASGTRGAPMLLVDPSTDLLASPGEPVVCGMAETQFAIVLATDVWLQALGAWVRYHAWDDSSIVTLQRRLAALR
jgi:hypothetical protein